ncbi:MAG: NADH-quinone oxidoreductase subunit NuoH [Desulfobacteraceae bacterium]|nr:MAG: NADH-quinone oxidoreductase subunit NuoH [Desulfobacteraceae bacterium]
MSEWIATIEQAWQVIYQFAGPVVLTLVIGLVAVFTFAALNAMFLVWLERKVAGHIQLRIGPKEVGPFGVLQTVIDALKLVGKELITPRQTSKFLFRLAPILVFVPAVVPFVVLPFSKWLQIRDLNAGLLLIIAFGGINVIAILMGGWASNNKYALLGAMRSVAQNVAYEIPLLLAAMSVVLMAGTLSLQQIVGAQEKVWFVFQQPLAFLIYMIAVTAETNRAPFDIPEAESELVAGFHTEYSGMRFSLFFLAEYTEMFVVAAVATTLFLGGWQGPFLPGIWWFMAKAFLLIFVAMWARWTFPRLRFDQLMNFAWKYMTPLALTNLLATAVLRKLGVY